MASLDKAPIELNDFSGGANLVDPEYLMDLNESPDCPNITLLQKGWKKRNGDSVFNSSAMVGSSTAIVGLGYYKLNAGTEFLNAVAGTKFFTSSGLTGTMTDNTGAVTITSGSTNIWTPVNFGALQIWFGGAPDAPFKYSGSGNAAALGGTPPSAYTGFSANNRVFGISTSANPSRIYWTVLGNAEDWAGTGSGNFDVQANDGEPLLCGIQNGTDTAILFKNSSTHLMSLTRAPFPIFQIQKGVGSAGRYSAVNVNGTIYLITPGLRMKATVNGKDFADFPDSVNSLWDRVTSSRIPYIQGVYYSAENQIRWYVSIDSSSTNNYCIVWDLEREAWLYYPTGSDCNVVAVSNNKKLYAGHYDGKIYLKDDPTATNDASEGGAAVDGYWRTPYKNLGGIDSVVHPQTISFSAAASNNSTIDISYGFDYGDMANTKTIQLATDAALWDVAYWDQANWAGSSDYTKADRVDVLGRGNLFSCRFRNAQTSQDLTFQGASIRLRPTRARKQMVVS